MEDILLRMADRFDMSAMGANLFVIGNRTLDQLQISSGPGEDLQLRLRFDAALTRTGVAECTFYLVLSDTVDPAPTNTVVVASSPPFGSAFHLAGGMPSAGQEYIIGMTRFAVPQLAFQHRYLVLAALNPFFAAGSITGGLVTAHVGKGFSTNAVRYPAALSNLRT